MGMKLLFHIDANDQPVFDSSVLRQIVSQIGSRRVSVISTVGNFREGKSFFDNILLKGLENGKASFHPSEIIGGPNGVPFKNGPDRHTVGIQVWDQVFTKRDQSGNELAVVLLDTQGMFDTESKMKHSTIIFMIALMISSNLIFNKKGYMNAHDLSDMGAFIEMSRMGQGRVGQNLLFLMRDWQGEGEGGLTPRYLQQLRSSAARAKELREVLDGVFEAFDKVECFTVLAPGGAVTRADGSIRVSDCDQSFLKSLCTCADHVLDNLEPKKLLSTCLDGKTFESYVQQVIHHVRENSALCVNNALQATARLSYQDAKERAMTVFLKELESFESTLRSQTQQDHVVKSRLDQIVANSVKIYESRPLFGTPQEKSSQLASVKKDLENKCNEVRSRNSERLRQQAAMEEMRKREEQARIEREQAQRRAEEERRLREAAEARRQQQEREAQERMERMTQDLLRMSMQQPRVEYIDRPVPYFVSSPFNSGFGGGFSGFQEDSTPVRRGPGRPPGSKNKPKPEPEPPRRGPGRPPGSKNKPK